MIRRRKIPDSINLAPIWRRRARTLLAVILLLGVVGFERGLAGTSRGGDYARYHDKIFEVSKVVDGDTFDINTPDGSRASTRIRLWGVDTPEVEGSSAGVAYFGPEASAFAKQTLQGRTVRIVLSPTKTRGKYGRLLAYVFLDAEGTMYNEQLLTAGFAYADWRFPHPYKRQFEQIEQRAKRSGEGLWANVRFEQMPAWRQRMEQERQ